MKTNKKKTVIIAVIIIILGFAGWRIFLKKPAPSFTVETASNGNIVQSVSESGVVKMGDSLDLSFQSGGTISKVYVGVGDEVSAGQLLATLDTDQLAIQIQEAQSNLTAAKVSAQSAQTALSNAQTAVQTAQQNFNDATASAQVSLDNAYGDALNASQAAYLNAYNALNTVKTIRDTYFTFNDQEGLAVTAARDSISQAVSEMKTSLDKAQANPSDQNIDDLLSVAIKSLQTTSAALTTIRQACDVSVYQSTVSSTDKSSLDTQRGYINTALTTVTNDQQAIATAKVTNNAAVNTASSQVATAQGNLKAAQDNVALYQAKITQAQAQLDLLNSQMQNSSIYAPAAGKITDVEMKEGETAQPSVPVFSFMTTGTAQVQTDIYEGDIVKIKVGDPVTMDFTAFPDQTFTGNIISIDPAQELINGVVYYKVTNSIDNAPQEIRPGMTVDITVKTAEKDNVLTVSGSAIETQNGKTYVQLVGNGATTTLQEVQTGLQGDNNQVEIVSGLKEGQQIAIPD